MMMNSCAPKKTRFPKGRGSAVILGVIACVAAVLVLMLLLRPAPLVVAPQNGSNQKANSATTASLASSAEATGEEEKVPPVESTVDSEATSVTESPAPVAEIKTVSFTANVILPESNDPKSGFEVEFQIGEYDWFKKIESEEPQVLARGTTDSNGSVVLEIAEGKIPSPKVMPRVVIRKAGFTTVRALLLGFEEGNFSGKFTGVEVPAFRAPEAISGKVVTLLQEPVANATVGSKVFPIGKKNYPYQEATGEGPKVFYYLEAETMSNEAGEFVLEGLPTDWVFYVPARATGYETGSTENPVNVGEQEAIIFLRNSACQLSGLIRNKSGTPITGAQVFVQKNVGRQSQSPFLDRRQISAISDSEGKFSFPELPSGQTFVFARPQDILLSSYSSLEVVDLERGKIGTVELILPDPVTFWGTIVDEQTEKPLQGVQVSGFVKTLESENGVAVTFIDSVKTNIQGQYELTVQPWSGETSIYIETPTGYISNSRMPYYTELIEFYSSLDSTRRLEKNFRLSPTIQKEGIVYLADGTTPASKAVVSLLLESYPSDVPTTITDTEGRYTIGTTYNTPYALKVTHSSGWGHQPMLSAEGDPSPIVLQSYGAISGKIVFPKSMKPVVLSLVTNSETGDPFAISMNNYQITNPSGIFYVDQLAAGEYSLTLKDQNSQSGSMINATIRGVEVRTGEITEGVELVIEEGDFIVGSVVDTDGKPVVKANVYFGALNGYGSLQTDEEGLFEIQTAGKDVVLNYISINKEGYTSQFKSNVTIYESPLLIELTKLGTFEIQAVDAATKEPLPLYSYVTYNDAWLNIPIWNDMMVVKEEDGKTELKNLPSRPVKVNVLELTPSGRPTGRKGSARFTYGETTSPVIIEVKEPYSASGKVVDVSGDPVAGADVKLLLYNNEELTASTDLDEWKNYDDTIKIKPVPTNSKGEFTIEGLPMGTYGLIAMKGTDKSPAIDLEISNRNATGLELTLQTSGEIRGTITGLDGKPMRQKGEIRYSVNQFQESIMVQQEADGTYLIPDLSPNTYTVNFSFDQNKLNEIKQVQLGNGESKVVDVDFSTYVKINGSFSNNGKSGVPESCFMILKRRTASDSELPRTIGTSDQQSKKYTEYVLPSNYHITLTNRFGGNFIVKEFEVLAQPKEQTFDVDFKTTKAFVVLEPEDQDTLIEGLFQFEQRLPSGDYTLREQYTTNKNNLVEPIPPGEYRVTYASRNKLEKGSSDWVTITEGGENIIVVFINKNTDDDSLIGRLQQALKALGYNPGPIDGLWGSMTSAALLEFQTDRGLQETGQINEESKKALGL